MDVAEDSAGQQSAQTPDELADVLLRWRSIFDRKFSPNEPDLTAPEDRQFWELTVKGLLLMAERMDRKAKKLCGPSASSVDASLLTYAAVGITEALDGFLPGAWRRKPRESRTETLSMMELGSVRVVASYYRAISEGLFTDRAPTSFLQNCFEVTRKTINNWAKADPKAIYPNCLSTTIRLASRGWLGRCWARSAPPARLGGRSRG
jgi:hypothetical protein